MQYQTLALMASELMVKFIFWRLSERYCLCKARKQYKRKSESVTENNDYKTLNDFTIPRDTLIDAQRPDIVVIDERKKETKVMTIAIPWEAHVINEKDLQKMEKYKLLKDEIARMNAMRRVTVIPIVVWAPGSLTTSFDKSEEKLGLI
ncbi:Hypothetical predicted protein [Octopus vulgaris]|uniref:Uncharacterized protein n=1 Tax=Octopus vulgaris TaxID=6645 RepID=A0AA36AR47_OCTVU|nr:Hypothetical predicted protein [Octopus vulgaris]